MHRSPTITVTRGRFGSTAGQVLEQTHAGGVVTRDELAAGCGLSLATVGRTVGALVEAGVLRERPDLVRAGAVGRPGLPVDVDPSTFVTVGVHLGRRIDTVALGDLNGRVITHELRRRPPGKPSDLDALSKIAARLLGEQSGRAPLAAGLVAPWRELGIDPGEFGHRLFELTGLEVRTGDHVAAVAATEFFHRRQGTPGVTLYVYARDTIGFAVAVDKGDQTEVSRTGSLTHFPAGADTRCRCGRTGCLEVTAGDDAVAAAAHRAGLVSSRAISEVYAAADDPAVHTLLADRARTLGRVAAVVHDMVAPDRVVLVGQAFTGCPAVLEEITTAFDDATALTPAAVSFTRFGSGIQAAASCTVALGPVYDDPLGVVPRARADHSTPA